MRYNFWLPRSDPMPLMPILQPLAQDRIITWNDATYTILKSASLSLEYHRPMYLQV
jgi:hypothetical protein